MASLSPCCPATPASSGGLIANRYRPIRLIGRGSQGNVWECEDVVTTLRVACKSFTHAAASRPDICAELCGLKLVAGHPNIVRLVEFAVDSSEVHLVMELAPGGDDLLSEIMRRGPLAEPLAANVFRQLASAVAFCHSCGVMHRDVKPDNVLIVRGGRTAQQRPPTSPPSPPSPPPPLTLPPAPYPTSVATSRIDNSTATPAEAGEAGCNGEGLNGGARDTCLDATCAAQSREPLRARDENRCNSSSGNCSSSANSSSGANLKPTRDIKSIFSRSFPSSYGISTSLTLFPANHSEPAHNPRFSSPSPSPSPFNPASFSSSSSAPPSAVLVPASPSSPASPDRGIVGVKLADFGASIVVQGGLSGRLKDRGAGTRGYKAPEMGGKSGYDMKADVYSLGITLCAMLTGHIPDTPLVDFCSSIWKGVSADARDLVRRMLEDEPDQRPSSFEVLEHRWLNQNAVRNLDMATRCPSLLASLLPSPSPLSSPSNGALAAAASAAVAAAAASAAAAENVVTKAAGAGVFATAATEAAAAVASATGLVAARAGAGVAAAAAGAASRWVPRGSFSFSSPPIGASGRAKPQRGLSVTASCASISCA